MKIKFSYSKNNEFKKLLNIYDEYEWFVKNNFPIVLPKFYKNIYQENRKEFSKDLKKELNKIYNKEDYKNKKTIIENNWKKQEKEITKVFNNLGFKKKKYKCIISLYGPEGQYNYPNTINLRIDNEKDIENSNETIVHEIIHLLIFNKELGYEETEKMVDNFFIETDLKKIFPNYKIQNIISPLLHDNPHQH